MESRSIPLESLINAIPDVLARIHVRDPQRAIRGIVFDSRQVEPDSVFVAINGTSQDGRRFIADAVRRGACAVISDDAPADGAPQEPAFILVTDPREALGCLADRFWGEPSRDIQTIGVTGTNGKTTTAWLTASILESAGDKPGLVGTVMLRTPLRRENATVTTPDPVSLHQAIAEVRQGGGRTAVLEVSSHALHQRRTAGIRFDVGVFTNLSGDHLDYHGDMNRYAAAKRALFESLTPSGRAVLNGHDPRSVEMARRSAAPVDWFLVDGEGPVNESIRPSLSARIHHADLEGTRLSLHDTREDREAELMLGLIGRHNVENALAAAAAARAVGADLGQVVTGLETAAAVPGRLERVSPPGGPTVLVDYAHTDDALRRVLESIRPMTSGALVVVFGCGGDRDRSKRPRMAQAVEGVADLAIVTSDNPRSEDPDEIIHEIRAGFASPERHLYETDRAAAIHQGVSALRRPGDVLVIAGKGHETYQQIDGKTLPFDDRDQGRQALEQLWRGERPEVAIRTASEQLRAASAG